MQNTISQRGQCFTFDVVVIGSGVAGLCYLLEMAKLRPHAKLAIITKGKLSQSNTQYAQGGIAAANAPHDMKDHITDTLSAGDGLCNSQAVSAILEKGPDAIQYLIEHGVLFDRDSNNHLLCGKEAGHSDRRIFHVGDQTGAAIIAALLHELSLLKNIMVFENHTAINLITQIEPHQPGVLPEVVGVYLLAEKTGLIHTFQSNVIVLATGGAGKVYRYTTNPSVATGDGVAMAYRAGARVGGLEFYQFHPTLLYHPNNNNFLLSEALRGEGAYLLSPITGERFMKNYAPEQMELATRDVVSRAIFCEMENTGVEFVYLDITHKSKAFLQKRFPMIYETLLSLGLDLSCDKIPVVPAAHYMGGGILSDVHGKTDIKRLYAIGETAFTGLHGANRLASNSLLEGLVMSRNAAIASLAFVDSKPNLYNPIRDWDSTTVVDLRRATQIKEHWRGLRGEMSCYAGIVRTEAGLYDQLKLVLTRKEIIEECYWKYTITRDLVELRNIVLIAELIVRSALDRRESRGGHYREDYLLKSQHIQNSILKMQETGSEAK